MPLFMDVREMNVSISMDDVATAHAAALPAQGEFDVRTFPVREGT